MLNFLGGPSRKDAQKPRKLEENPFSPPRGKKKSLVLHFSMLKTFTQTPWVYSWRVLPNRGAEAPQQVPSPGLSWGVGADQLSPPNEQSLSHSSCQCLVRLGFFFFFFSLLDFLHFRAKRTAWLAGTQAPNSWMLDALWRLLLSMQWAAQHPRGEVGKASNKARNHQGAD